MTSVDGMWYLADKATRRATEAYHRITEQYATQPIEQTYHKRVSRGRFRTLATRIQETGGPYGAHTLVHRDAGEILLVRHEGVNLWVLPGGGVDASESFRDAAERELGEEAGIDAIYNGLAMLNRVEITCDNCDTWGILPVFHAKAETTTPTVTDPDGEISQAQWFAPEQLPSDTRDRDDLIEAAKSLL